MNLNDFQKRLDKLKTENPEFSYTLNIGADEADFSKLEQRIGKILPDKIIELWKHFNGVKTSNPDFKVLSIQDLQPTENGLIHFATFDGKSKVYFDTNRINQAGEWSIINYDEEYVLTLTISSFWSNKIWHWLVSRTEIWKDAYWVKK